MGPLNIVFPKNLAKNNLLQGKTAISSKMVIHFQNSLYAPYLFDPSMSDAGKNLDEDDNTKAEAAKMQKEYENLKDSTKVEQPSSATSQSAAHDAPKKHY